MLCSVLSHTVTYFVDFLMKPSSKKKYSLLFHFSYQNRKNKRLRPCLNNDTMLLSHPKLRNSVQESGSYSQSMLWHQLTLKGKSKNKPEGHNCKYQVIWPHAVRNTPTHRCWELSGTCFWLALIPSCQLCEKMHTQAFSSYPAEQLSHSILMDCECPTELLKKAY